MANSGSDVLKPSICLLPTVRCLQPGAQVSIAGKVFKSKALTRYPPFSGYGAQMQWDPCMAIPTPILFLTL